MAVFFVLSVGNNVDKNSYYDIKSEEVYSVFAENGIEYDCKKEKSSLSERLGELSVKSVFNEVIFGIFGVTLP